MALLVHIGGEKANVHMSYGCRYLAALAVPNKVTENSCYLCKVGFENALIRDHV